MENTVDLTGLKRKPIGEERVPRRLISLESSVDTQCHPSLSRPLRSTSASVAMACAAGRAAGLLPQNTNFEAFTRVKTSIRPAVERDKHMGATYDVAATSSLRTGCIMEGLAPASVGGHVASTAPTSIFTQHEANQSPSLGKQRGDSRDSAACASRGVPYGVSTSSVGLGSSSRFTGDGPDNLGSRPHPDSPARLDGRGEGSICRPPGSACYVEPWEFMGNDVGLQDDHIVGGRCEGLGLPPVKSFPDLRGYCDDFNIPSFVCQEPAELFERSTLSSLSNPEAAAQDQSSGHLANPGQPTKSKSVVHRRKRCADGEQGEQDPVDHDEQGDDKNSWARRAQKKGRAAEVHNQSERRRRDRINEKMRALQELIPNSNKTDKASMLDDAVEYVKMLQWQLQVMAMRLNLNNHLAMAKQLPGIPPNSLMGEAAMLQVPYAGDAGLHMMGTIPGPTGPVAVPESGSMMPMIPPHQQVLGPGWANFHMEPQQ